MESIVKMASANTKNDILDPLSAIIKLFIYSFKPVGTKISIGGNKLHIQENTYIQGAWRRWNGDTKNDVNILLCPVLYACTHYLKVVCKRGSKVTNALDPFHVIFKGALDGLTNMKQTYAGMPIVYNIEHIVNIIGLFMKKQGDNKSPIVSEEDISETCALIDPNRNSDSDGWLDETVINTKLNEVNSIINVDTPIYKIKENIYQHLDTAWTPHRKNILFGFVKEITEVHNVALKTELLDGLAKFMDCMDIIVSNVLLNNAL
jgi:hypothetical protein